MGSHRVGYDWASVHNTTATTPKGKQWKDLRWAACKREGPLAKAAILYIRRVIIWTEDLAWSVVWSHSRAETNRWTLHGCNHILSKGFIIITAMIGNPHRICYWFHLLMGDWPERTSNVPSNLHLKKYAVAIYNKLQKMAKKLFSFLCAHASAIWLGIISHEEFVSWPLEPGLGYRTSFDQSRGLKSTCLSGLSLLWPWESWNCHEPRLSFGDTWPSELLTNKQHESRPF